MNSEYGRIIKERRAMHGDTQERRAEKMGVGRSTVSNWEKGIMPPYLPDLVRYLSDDPARNGHVAQEHTIQLPLPFDPPINLEVRIAPQRADSIHLAVQWKKIG
jgi:transcriptional regulator with XRE-family HTH domain